MHIFKASPIEPRNSCIDKVLNILIQMLMIQRIHDRPLDRIAEIRQIHHHARLRIDLAVNRNRNCSTYAECKSGRTYPTLIIMAVSVRIVAFAVHFSILRIAQMRAKLEASLLTRREERSQTCAADATHTTTRFASKSTFYDKRSRPSFPYGEEGNCTAQKRRAHERSVHQIARSHRPLRHTLHHRLTLYQVERYETSARERLLTSRARRSFMRRNLVDSSHYIQQHRPTSATAQRSRHRHGTNSYVSTRE